MDHSTGGPVSASVALTGVHAGVDLLVESVRDGAVADLTHDELAALIAGVRAQQARLEAVALAAVGEVDARGSFALDGALTAGAWLRATTRATPGEAAGTVRTARTLRAGALPGTVAALAAGEVSARAAQTITDGIRAAGAAGARGEHAPAAAVALIEPEVLEVARHADTRAVAAVMTAFGHALDPDAADAAALARYDRRGLTLSPTPNGEFAIAGSADEVSGAVLAEAIDAAAPLVTGDTRTPAQIRLDALVGICRAFLENPDAPTRGGGGHPHVIVTTDDTTLFPHQPTDATDADPPTAEFPAAEFPAADCPPGDPAALGRAVRSPGATLSFIGRIGAGTARRIACDAQLTTVLLGPDGEVTANRTQRRFFTAAQRRAMIARDGDRCPWPWCDRPATWSDGHHLIWSSRHGPTTVANGALPCPGHHTMCHEGGWTLHRLPDGRYQATHHDGRTLGPEPHPPGHNRPTRPPPRRRQ